VSWKIFHKEVVCLDYY